MTTTGNHSLLYALKTALCHSVIYQTKEKRSIEKVFAEKITGRKAVPGIWKRENISSRS